MTRTRSATPLAQDDIDFFWQHGYLLVRGVLSPDEAEHYRRVVLNLLPRDLHIPDHWQVVDGRIKPYHTPGNETFDGPEFIPLWQNPTLYAVMAQLIGHPNLHMNDGSVAITLRNNRVTKSPLSQGLHLDPAVPENAENFLLTDEELEIGGCYYFTDVEPGGGGIHVVPGGHRIVEEEARSVPNGRQLHDCWRKLPAMETVEVPAKAGDFVLMHHLMPHAASHNRHARTRVAQFFRYGRDDHPYPGGDRPGDPPPGKSFNDLQLRAMTPLGRRLLGVSPW
ncbi:phytanoyl-CoA dioxygenase family protein [Longispora sp. NPDC051575]|uniref:phytanoyl-CoA dioxygenase family protein n=1 Tax=Longispora sp. NPDC051575 TaxID=3154943 RepID=UPI0034406176